MASPNGNGDKQPITAGFIKTWLPIAVIIVALVTQWVTMGQQITQLRIDLLATKLQLVTDITEMDQRLTNEDKLTSAKVITSEQKLVEIQVQLAGIQKDLQYIKQAIDNHVAGGK